MPVVHVFDSPTGPGAVLAAAVSAMAFGLIWYHPRVLGDSWLTELGYDRRRAEEMRKGSWKQYTIVFAGLIVTALVLQAILSALEIKTPLGGAFIGIWVWLGFVGTIKLNDVLFGGRSVKLYMIDGIYQLFSLAIMGAVLTLV